MADVKMGVYMIHVMFVASIVFGIYDYWNNQADNFTVDLRFGLFYGILVLLYHAQKWRTCVILKNEQAKKH